MRAIITAVLAIVCMTGCATAEDAPNANGKPSTETLADTGKVEKKTFSEWVAIHVAEHKAAHKRHPELADIEKGTPLFLTGFYTNPGHARNRQQGRNLYTPLGQRYFDAYEKFVSSDRGKAMLAKWKSGGKLDPKDADFRWVIYATLADNSKQSTHFSPNSGEDAKIAAQIKRAYLREGLFTRDEIDFMRYRFSRMGKAKGYTCGSFILGATGANLEKTILWTDYIPTMKWFSAGDAIPDMKFWRYDSLMEKVGLPDKFEQPYSFDAMVTPRMLEALDESIRAFTLIEENGKKRLVPDYSEFEGKEGVLDYAGKDMLRDTDYDIAVLDYGAMAGALDGFWGKKTDPEKLKKSYKDTDELVGILKSKGAKIVMWNPWTYGGLLRDFYHEGWTLNDWDIQHRESCGFCKPVKKITPAGLIKARDSFYGFY